ncbi:4'-phosphopantetheinyl transferase family protein [Biformimicrobium ophioploci]|uniref:4'-phosphopantetheinyl transferase n=1 Tax=Biformimicrobium ophioploci TaxID=3036711 RepID=A0ABQ6M059_9GAMM|nr:4'-phosphopantetheinyl transferase superfamily protein [Microbulbifer sp. NKW57]GMG87744.1 hypothetical protein MNKW57_20650 [Microbulbifer sp. NKW57]
MLPVQSSQARPQEAEEISPPVWESDSANGHLQLFATKLSTGLPEESDWTCLSDAEKQRASKFHYATHSNCFVSGRAFLRKVLASVLGFNSELLVIGTGRYGKPEVAGNPIFFNLSHSFGLAVLAVSECSPVGIDVELGLNAHQDFRSLVRVTLTQREKYALEQVNYQARWGLFLEYWMAKESLMKCIGTGMQLSPAEIELELSRARPVGYLGDRFSRFSLKRVPLVEHRTCCYITT